MKRMMTLLKPEKGTGFEIISFENYMLASSSFFDILISSSLLICLSVLFLLNFFANDSVCGYKILVWFRLICVMVYQLLIGYLILKCDSFDCNLNYYFNVLLYLFIYKNNLPKLRADIDTRWNINDKYRFTCTRSLGLVNL